MNSIMQNDYPVFRLYQALRTQLMGLLSDDDLAFSPGGDNPTLGELCREMGGAARLCAILLDLHHDVRVPQ